MCYVYNNLFRREINAIIFSNTLKYIYDYFYEFPQTWVRIPLP